MSRVTDSNRSASPPTSRSGRSWSTSAPAARHRSKTASNKRAFGSLKYEHLYRLEIDDGYQLGQEVEAYRQNV